MPINWIERTFQPVLTAPADQLRLFPVWLLLGPRQVGKSSLLHKCAGGHAYVDLDDLTTRERANRDPALFVRELRPPFTIDEIQYAPDLLSPIKQLVDAGDLAPGAIRLTGSQNFQVMEGVTMSAAVWPPSGACDPPRSMPGAGTHGGSDGIRPALRGARRGRVLHPEVLTLTVQRTEPGSTRNSGSSCPLFRSSRRAAGIPNPYRCTSPVTRIASARMGLR